MFETIVKEEKPALLPWVKKMLLLWLVTSPIALVFVGLSGMAADAGDHWFVTLFIWAALTYPISVTLAYFFRRACPYLVFLPLFNIALWLFAGTFP
jgi:hypothetical protein